MKSRMEIVVCFCFLLISLFRPVLWLCVLLNYKSFSENLFSGGFFSLISFLGVCVRSRTKVHPVLFHSLALSAN